ncbi:UbiD family decarboxylase [Tissierella pigra]|uniref:UbiD family decarboxylase n=1 Tax=Tissierella pigra TaxID=2607614 RepID=A0A6N7XGH2_9FIRM|nr:UbiD family decarboxylase [Tissierella pigra]MBU5425434.1 UbiD family decarboxylase [Tissierella pigra]MSU01109.1 UbiD family decarboxylase [Tissierella pigra]
MLRSTLETLRANNSLLETDKEVDYIYEMGAVLKYFNNKVPMLFNNIKGNPLSSVGGLYGDRMLIYDLLGIDHNNRIERFMNSIVNPQPYKVVSNGKVKENIIKRNIDIQRILPINKFQEKDSSSFITAGVMVVKDPDTGKFFTSIRRLQVNGGNQLSALIASPKLTNDFLELEKQGKPLEVAIILGYDAPFLMASQISSATYGVDKYMVDSSLRGEPLELVPCETVDLLVPANAEIVLEGRIVPNKRELEGPFGELMGYYGAQAPHPIIEVDCILHRNNPIYQTAFPCREEHVSNGLIREMELYYHLKNQVDVVDVNVTEGGGYRFNAFIAIRKHKKGDAKTAILAALGLNKDLKQVVIVNEDVNIFDLQEIEWAITTRSQASMDYTIVEGALGSSLEPSHDIRGVTDKVGIDATKPLEDNTGKFSRAIIPEYDNIDISKYFPNI